MESCHRRAITSKKRKTHYEFAKESSLNWTPYQMLQLNSLIAIGFTEREAVAELKELLAHQREKSIRK